MNTQTLTIAEIDALARLTTNAAHHKIQQFLKQGFTVQQIAESLSRKAKCSLRVAKTVVRDAQDADEWFYVSELSA